MLGPSGVSKSPQFFGGVQEPLIPATLGLQFVQHDLRDRILFSRRQPTNRLDRLLKQLSHIEIIPEGGEAGMIGRELQGPEV